MSFFFPSFSKPFFTVKIFHNAIIDESGIYWPVGDQRDGFCRQWETEDSGKEGTDDADLRPKLPTSLPASLPAELPSGLLPEKRIILFL